MTPPTSNPWLYLVGLLFTFLGGIGLKDILIGLFKRKPRAAVEVTNNIDLAAAARAQAEAVRQYSQEIEEDARQARESAQQAWRLVDTANTKLMRVTAKLDDSTYKLEQATRYMDALFAKIFEQGATIDDVRGFVKIHPVPVFREHRNGKGIGH